MAVPALIGDNTAGATEAIIIDMDASLFSSSIVDLSGLTFSNWGGQGETITVIGDQDTANTITGSSENDVLLSGTLDDTLDGGSAGSDTASYENALASVSIDLSLITAQDTGSAGMDTFVSIENVTGSDFDDVLSGSGSANIIHGGDGDDMG